MRSLACTLILLFTLSTASEAGGKPTVPDLLTDEIVDGQFGPGALYRIVRPANWNGKLFLYAHGIVSRSEPVELPSYANLFIGNVTSQGFAIAYSSYSENGWAVKDGAQRTHQLLGIFTSRFGPPTRVYIGGESMGGLIAIKLVEQYPGIFSGALALCAASGGARMEHDYWANTRALFDFYYPGILPGNAGAVPPETDITNEITLPAIAAMQGNLGGAFAIASIEQTPLPFANQAELIESVGAALAGNAGSYNNLAPELHGKPYFDNRNVVYTSGVLAPPLLAIINANVGRFDAAPTALIYMNHYYKPSGDLQIPMVMLSTSRDQVVPGIHRASYLNTVTAAGHSDLLVQRSINRYGHCVFTPAEVGTAFTDLVGWVESGIKPEP